MSFTYCTKEDLEKVKVGQELKINARYEDLTRENGEVFPYVARKDDVIVVEKVTEDYLVVRFIEDTFQLKTRNREIFGLFKVNPHHIQKF